MNYLLFLFSNLTLLYYNYLSYYHINDTFYINYTYNQTTSCSLPSNATLDADAVLNYLEGETMNIYDWLFILSVLAMIGLTLVRVYNICTLFKWFRWSGIVLVMLGFGFSYGLSFIVTILDYSDQLKIAWLYVASGLLVLHLAIATIIEIFISWIPQPKKKRRGVPGD